MATSPLPRPEPPRDMGRPGWTLLASGDETNGGFELFHEVRPVVGGPPPHVHRDRDEGFFVLEGRFRFERGHEELELQPGDFSLVPRGTRHAFRTLAAPSRTLILIAPAGLEEFFRGMGSRMAAGATALEAMAALSAIHDARPVP